MSRDCKHGRLARSCEVCELEVERDEALARLAIREDRCSSAIDALEAENTALRALLGRARGPLAHALHVASFGHHGQQPGMLRGIRDLGERFDEIDSLLAAIDEALRGAGGQGKLPDACERTETPPATTPAPIHAEPATPLQCLFDLQDRLGVEHPINLASGWPDLMRLAEIAAQSGINAVNKYGDCEVGSDELAAEALERWREGRC